MPSLLASLVAIGAAASPLTVPAGGVAPAKGSSDPCAALPSVRPPYSFSPGETLEFDLDALGAQAGKLYLKVLPLHDGSLPVEVNAQTNTFFSKVRRVSGGGTSYLNPKTLHPFRYSEDATENEVRKTAEVSFISKSHQVSVDWKVAEASGHTDFQYDNDGLDVGGAVYLLRQIPFELGRHVCFDAYGIRRLWRVTGTVEAREHVSLPVGEFEAWHLSGVAVRIDRPNQERREIHIWISDDDRRLPLVVVGVIDLGAVRATLSSYSRPKEKRARGQGKETLKW